VTEYIYELLSAQGSYPLKQVDELMVWCTDDGIKPEHLFDQHEWRW
jgi:hypothetical protein